MRLLVRIAVCIGLAIALAACDQDPFGLSHRRVSGDYYLQQWEDGQTYYLDDSDTESTSGGGVLDGTVEKIGWDNDYIVVKRNPMFAGDGEGWMVVDVRKKIVSGPYSKQFVDKLPQARGIKFFDPAKAWNILQ